MHVAFLFVSGVILIRRGVADWCEISSGRHRHCRKSRSRLIGYRPITLATVDGAVANQDEAALILTACKT